YTFGYSAEVRAIIDLTREFSVNCFVARTDALPNDLSFILELDSAEDSALIAQVGRRKKPIFSYAATAFFRSESIESRQFLKHPNRQRDENSLLLRCSLLWSPLWFSGRSIKEPLEYWRLIASESEARELEGVTEPVLIDGSLSRAESSIHRREDLDA